ncbi:hypothetical protein HMPREF1705_04303 [Acetomicrobium hydrogeniformans ATCC BAA-1850]|uniref:Uncharacterized protein n=1 Tax=Acetomicrobium hydrogeniformans ATCC BAA-1850 TaxID=592015 RepID=A0A0T5X9R0_9BACT|nr:hypothetical protein HMPREF1705_04303 [Acetomicrobium hydrogeniformans ATCC BAA-1850]
MKFCNMVFHFILLMFVRRGGDNAENLLLMFVRRGGDNAENLCVQFGVLV